MKELKVLIDCDKVKNPNTGLFHYCYQLVKTLEQNKAQTKVDPVVLITAYVEGIIPSVKSRVIKLLDRIWFRCSSDTDVFHAPFQLGKYFPRNTKTVLTIHDINYIYEKPKSQWGRYIRAIKKNIERSDYIIFISHFVQNDVLEHIGQINKPYKVIYNGCNIYNGPQVEQPKNYNPSAEFLFSIGTVLPKKNFHTLPTLLVGNDMELIIAGNESEYVEKVMDEAAHFGVADRVKIIGPVTEADKDWYYRNCKAFVFPSLAEGFGLPVVEAMYYGKPTFLSSHTSLTEIGGEYAYYFNHDFDRKKMRTELTQGLEDFPSRNLQKQIDYAASFSWVKTAEQYCQVYRELAPK